MANRSEWVPAGALNPGDIFLSHDGQLVILEALHPTGEITTVYNLRIAQHHTYFVGSQEWGFSVWVHNTYKGYVSGAYDKLESIAGHQNHHLLQQSAFPHQQNVKSGPVIRVTGRTSDLDLQHNIFHRVLEGFWEPHRVARTTPFVSEYLEAVTRASKTAGFSAKEAHQMTSSARRFLSRIGLAIDDIVPNVPGQFPSQFLPGGNL